MKKQQQTYFQKSENTENKLYDFDTWVQQRPIALRLLFIKNLDFTRIDGRFDFGQAYALRFTCFTALYDLITYIVKVTNLIIDGKFQESQWPTTVGSSYIMCSLRGLTLLIKRKEIAKLFNDFDDIFPKDIRMQKKLKVGEYTQRFLQRAKYLHYYVSLMFLTYYAFPALRYIIFYDGSNGGPVPDIYYPHPLWLPEYLANKPKLYICYYLYAAMSISTGVSNLLYWDHCLNILTSQLCMHYEYIGLKISELNASESRGNETVVGRLQKQLWHIFEYQQHIKK